MIHLASHRLIRAASPAPSLQCNQADSRPLRLRRSRRPFPRDSLPASPLGSPPHARLVSRRANLQCSRARNPRRSPARSHRHNLRCSRLRGPAVSQADTLRVSRVLSLLIGRLVNRVLCLRLSRLCSPAVSPLRYLRGNQRHSQRVSLPLVLQRSLPLSRVRRLRRNRQCSRAHSRAVDLLGSLHLVQARSLLCSLHASRL
jgi:hypothetical protein